MRTLLALMNSKLFDCKPGNRCRVFDAGLRDFEHLLGNYLRYGVIALLETKSTQRLPIGGDQPLNFIRPQRGVLDELVNGHSLHKRTTASLGGCRNLFAVGNF